MNTKELADKRRQVADQCRAVEHLATALAKVHHDRARMFTTPASDFLLEIVGKHTAALMETLGEILNGMDAVDRKEDKWLDPVFEKAHQMFPSRWAGA